MLGRNKSYTKLGIFSAIQNDQSQSYNLISFIKKKNIKMNAYPQKQLEASLSTSSLFAHPLYSASYSAEGAVVTHQGRQLAH